MKRTISILLVMLMTLTMLAGCAEEIPETPTEPQPGESLVWETMPKLTYGVMEYEKLEVLPWYSGRAEATGFGGWAETKDGFYRSTGKLWYCDKSDMSLWVRVCSKPNCNHGQMAGCNAELSWGDFVIRDGRIYFAAITEDVSDLYLKSKDGYVANAIFSRALNGSDGRFEYEIEETVLSDGGGLRSILRPGYYVQNSTKFETDGTWTGMSYYLSEDGLQLLCKIKYDSQPAQALLWPASFYGDSVFYNAYLGQELYCVKNGEVIEVKAATYEENGGYLSGSILRQFRTNEGYYDIDLETGDELLTSKPRLENSIAMILLPNCVIETTVGSADHPKDAERSMEIFDGESWSTVQLPKELQYAPASTVFGRAVIASDRILFRIKVGGVSMLYQVMLGQEELTMEFCCELG